MPDLQGVSSVFQSLNAAVMASQAVQAADMAARQGLASAQIDAKRLENLVTEMGQSADSAEISGEHPERPSDTGLPPSRARRRPPDSSGSPVSGAPSQRIDLIA